MINSNYLTEKEISNNFWAMKGIAIFSVVCAHVGIVTSNDVLLKYLSHILSNIGTIGVGIFYFISGYFYKFDTNNKSEFIKSKFIKIVLPWIFASTCIWLYVVLRKGNINFLSWFNFIIGNGSIFYFMTNLIIFFIIFAFLQHIKFKKTYIYMHILIFLIVLSEIFVIIESEGISLFPTQYLNFMLFIAYFATGQYLSIKKLNVISDKKYKFLLLLSTILVFSPLQLSYWHDFMTLVFEFLFILVTWLFCKSNNNKLKNFLILMGKNSFCIFLWHIPIAGIIVNLTNRVELLQYLIIFRPFLVCFIVYQFFAWVERYLNKKPILLMTLGINYKDKGIYIK